MINMVGRSNFWVCASLRLARLFNDKTGYDHNRNNFCLHDFHDLCTCKCEEPRGTWMWRPLCRKDESIWISVDTTPSDYNDDEKIMLKIFFTKSWLSAALAPAMTQSWAQTRAISMFIWITWFSIMIILHLLSALWFWVSQSMTMYRSNRRG